MAFSEVDGFTVNIGSIGQPIVNSPLTDYANVLLYAENNYVSIYNNLGMLNTASMISMLLSPGQLFNAWVNVTTRHKVYYNKTI